jgi:hypothetical protein
MHTKRKAAYKITAEMLSIYLFKKIINIEMIEFDKSRELLFIYASGEDLPSDTNHGKHYLEMAEGDEHPLLRIPRPE